ncbi:type II toxin-antitoxin system RelE/ParE family toxin [Bradyrhizobium sp. 83012]|uniref:Type II toxin-antitoxin system RelE/ParE family toxin n=1 Tax=Bradyrhizobium aeschynomenes TaxID=2734909 RepID=A0ABX2CJ25_9BRAD|nr:type II toxin-antitoxin system RelE/ParE family toxin [Bradyrhizobium aeschynomenes]NPU67430.1 type II toxin-antitoxin system RelE/ParE family toxin [Bradyrhizobium aeschynomenes]NPV21798.1 type II toxin-antitoxin system RelE/ParE family toxin [Bradyrhizobium aeschynomenes]
MVEIRQTAEFNAWLLGLRDLKAKARIAARIERAANGNLGDSKPVGEGVSEMRIDYGPGYRIYYRQRGDVLVILLCGGDKSTQRSDIRRAQALAKREA